jgi:hypothetical protein
MTDDLVKMARLAQRDERMSTGALYGALADRIEELEAKLDLSEGALDVASRSWGECQRVLGQTEAKLEKCQALMHAGLAEYQRRLVRAVRLIQFLDKEYQHVWGVTAKSEVRTVLAELEGELDD